MNTLLKSAGGITQVSADSRLLSNFDKVMEEAAASRPEYRKILEYIPGESGSDCPLHLYIIKHCDG